MARNGFDDAVRRGTTGAEAVEGLLAHARTQSRRGAVKACERAVALCRDLAQADPAAYEPLLARALRTTARALLRARRPGDALGRAEEAVALSRPHGGAPLVVALACLADVLGALHRDDEAAEAAAAADKLAQESP
ncbi:hypothetical protein [Nonomuraea sediminis]|uniref:hypothetical protein n=1 Tax=Nonomuraea sediminis TaxID=2835864 RepID=UPI001BDD7605|nr:hypothetical protein [Nonomuraea sediminis]